MIIIIILNNNNNKTNNTTNTISVPNTHVHIWVLCTHVCTMHSETPPTTETTGIWSVWEGAAGNDPKYPKYPFIKPLPLLIDPTSPKHPKGSQMTPATINSRTYAT